MMRKYLEIIARCRMVKADDVLVCPCVFYPKYFIEHWITLNESNCRVYLHSWLTSGLNPIKDGRHSQRTL